MGASITNAGKEDWTYFGTFNQDSAEHDLPANWTTLYIHVVDSRNGVSDTLLLLKDALSSGASQYVYSRNYTSVTIKANTNKITVTSGTAKVYYR